jgi:NADH-quinone oxidoreductase subunit L
VVGTAVEDDPPLPALAITAIAVVVVAIGVGLAWFLIGRRDVPRTAPQRVSWVTTAARNDLYGDAINNGLVVEPGRRTVSGLLALDHYGVDGTLTGGPVAIGAVANQARRVQNGFVRSFALSLLGGVLIVVLALLAVNLA